VNAGAYTLTDSLLASPNPIPPCRLLQELEPGGQHESNRLLQGFNINGTGTGIPPCFELNISGPAILLNIYRFFTASTAASMRIRYRDSGTPFSPEEIWSSAISTASLKPKRFFEVSSTGRTKSTTG